MLALLSVSLVLLTLVKGLEVDRPLIRPPVPLPKSHNAGEFSSSSLFTSLPSADAPSPTLENDLFSSTITSLRATVSLSDEVRGSAVNPSSSPSTSKPSIGSLISQPSSDLPDSPGLQQSPVQKPTLSKTLPSTSLQRPATPPAPFPSTLTVQSPPTPSGASPPPSQRTRLSTRSIAPIVVSVFLFVITSALVIYLVLRRRKRSALKNAHGNNSSPTSEAFPNPISAYQKPELPGLGLVELATGSIPELNPDHIQEMHATPAPELHITNLHEMDGVVLHELGSKTTSIESMPITTATAVSTINPARITFEARRGSE